mgnify:FL=1
MTACLAKVMPNNTFSPAAWPILHFPNSRINHYGQKEEKHHESTVKIGKIRKEMLKINNFYGQKERKHHKNTVKQPKNVKIWKEVAKNYGKIPNFFIVCP